MLRTFYSSSDKAVNTQLSASSDPYPDHVYVDLNMYNNNFIDPTNPQQYQIAEIFQSRDSPIILDPNYYNISVARFSISSSALSRMHQNIATTPLNSNLWISLSYNGVYYDNPVILSLITSNSTLVQERATYNINDFIDQINAQFLLSEASVALAGGPVGIGHVNMTYDNINGLFNMNIPSWYGTGTVGLVPGDGIGVHMSIQLYLKFNSFNTIQNAPLLYNNHDVTFRRNWIGNNWVDDIYLDVNNAGLGVTGVYMQQKQEKSWASSMLKYHRLIISTANLPIYSDYINTTTSTISQGSLGNVTFPILTDFFIGHDKDLQSQGENFIYTPTLLRLASLKGSSPISQFSIKVFTQNENTYDTYPLYIPPDGEMSIKLLFLKKGLTS